MTSGRPGGHVPSRPVLLAFAVSRLLVLAAATAAETLVERNPHLTSGVDAPLLRSLTAWDGWWYLGIARHGYSAVPLVDGYANVAFWPLYPFVVRILSLPWPALDGLVAVVLSNLAFLAALGLVERLGALVVGEERASRGAAFLALSPFSFAFSMAYPESCFFCLAAGACLATERGRWLVAGVLVGLATLARFQGLVLLPTLVWLGFRRLPAGQRLRLGWLGLAVVAALGYLGSVALLTGQPTGYLNAQAAWGRGVFGAGEQPLLANLDGIRLAELAAYLAGIYLLVFARPDRLPAAYVAWPVTALCLEFASGSLESVGRYLTVVVPLFWLLAGRRSSLARRTWPVVSAALLFLVAVLSFAGWYVP